MEKAQSVSTMPALLVLLLFAAFGISMVVILKLYGYFDLRGCPASYDCKLASANASLTKESALVRWYDDDNLHDLGHHKQ